MSESDRLIEVVQSLTDALAAARSKPVLYQLTSMAVLEAAEGLVQAGFEPARLHELGVPEDMAYFLDAKWRPLHRGPASAGSASRGTPHLRLVRA
jgi:hypothetical protein